MVYGRKTLLVIFVVALALRLGFALTRGDDLPYYDSRAYSQIAQHLLAGEGWHDDVGREASRAPGYPLFLAACYEAGVQSPRAIYAIQALADALMCVLLVLLARRLFGDRAGLVAGAVAVVYPFFIYFTGLLLAETLFTLGLVLLMYTLICLMEDKPAHPVAWTLAAGILMGVLIHLRSSFLLFPVLLLPLWLLRRGGWGRAVAMWVGMMVLTGLILMPWVVRNYRLFHHFIPTTLQVGESLYEANHPGADGGPAMEKIDWIGLRGGGMMHEYEHNEFFKQAAIRYIRDNPGQFARLAVKKFVRFWNPMMNDASYRGPLFSALSLLVWVPITALAIVGAIGMRRRGRELLLLLAPVLYYTAMHMVFVGSVRYRIPVMPFVIILAAAGLEAFIRGRTVGQQEARGG